MLSSIQRRIFNRIKKIIPPITETEKIALDCGTVSMDRDLFCGKVNHKKYKFPRVTKRVFSKDTLSELVTEYPNQHIVSIVEGTHYFRQLTKSLSCFIEAKY